MSKKSKPKLSESYTLQHFYPKNEKQQELIDLINDKEIVIATGVAGSGKTIVTMATALSLLGDLYKKIILIKSVTTIPGEAIGFVPGDADEKMANFILSYTWNIDKLLGKGSSKDLLSKGTMEVLPIAYIRGVSIDNAIVIIDEAQNIDMHTFLTIITRIGTNSKYIFLGDTEQVDRRRKEESCLTRVIDLFEDDEIIGIIKFRDEDCVRNPIIPKILEKLRLINE